MPRRLVAGWRGRTGLGRIEALLGGGCWSLSPSQDMLQRFLKRSWASR